MSIERNGRVGGDTISCSPVERTVRGDSPIDGGFGFEMEAGATAVDQQVEVTPVAVPEQTQPADRYTGELDGGFWITKPA